MSQVMVNIPGSITSHSASVLLNTPNIANDRKLSTAILNRLSGFGRTECIFEGKQAGHDPVFAGLANAFAQKPLLPPASKYAHEAESLVFSTHGRAIDDTTLKKYDSLREKALENETPGARAYFDALTRVLLLAPLTSSTDVFAPEVKTAFTLSLHSELDRILTSTDVHTLDQCQTELEGCRELLRQEKTLGPDQERALERLETLLAYRRGHVATLDVLTTSIDTLETTDTGSLQSLYDTLQTLRSKTTSGAKDTGSPLLHIALETLRYPAGELTGRLEAMSREKASVLRESGNRLLEQIRNSDTAEMAKTGLKAMETMRLSSAGTLLHADNVLLAEVYDKLEGAIKVNDCIAELNRSLKTNPYSALKLETCLETIETESRGLSLHDEDRSRLKEAQNRLRMSSADLRMVAKKQEQAFCNGIRARIANALSSDAFTSIQNDIALHLSLLRTTPEEKSNLGEPVRQASEETLKELSQHCYIERFKRAFIKAESTRMEAPTLEKCWEEVLSELTGADPAQKKTIEDLFTTSSKEAFNTLQKETDGLRALVAEITADARKQPPLDPGTMTARLDTLRKLPFTSISDTAMRRLLPADREILLNSLKELSNAAADSLFLYTGAPLASRHHLTAEHNESLHVLCTRAWGHPSMLKALEDCASRGELVTLLDTLGKARTTPGAATSDANTQIDTLLLAYPELDDLALSLKKDCTSPEHQERLLAGHESSRANREIARVISELVPEKTRAQLGLHNDTIDTTLLAHLVEAAATGTREGKQLGKMDLLLVRTLWSAHKAEGKTNFASFQSGLPEEFRTIPNLDKLMEAGIGNTGMLEGLSKSVAKISRSFGGRESLLQICERMATSNEKWAASLVLTKMTRNFIGGLSFSGTQAMEGGASAMARAVTRELAKTSGTGTLADTFRILFKKADNTVKENYAAQVDAFIGQSGELTAAMQRLEVLAAEYDVAVQEFTGEPTRKKMLHRLDHVLDAQTLARLQAGEPVNIKGASLSMGILLLKDILEKPEEPGSFASWDDRKKLLAKLNFQSYLDFEGMRGSNVPSSKRTGEKEFRACLRALQEAVQETDFHQAKTAMLSFLQSRSLDEKAEAILFFKTFKELSTRENVNKKFDSSVSSKNLTPYEQTLMDKLHRDMEVRLVGHIGMAHKQDISVQAAKEMKVALLKEMGKVLDGARRAFSTQVLGTMEKAIQVSLCNQFLAMPETLSGEDLLRQRSDYPSLTDWPFYRNCLGDLQKLGIAPSLAEPFLMESLLNMKGDTFTSLARKIKTDPGLAFRGFAVSASTPKAMRTMIQYGKFQEVTKQFMETLKEPGTSLTLNSGGTFSLAIPVVETGAVEVKAHIGAALRSGMSVWKDESGYHMTLMRTKSTSVGASVEGLLNAIEVSAKVNIDAGKGCDLLFTDEKNCQQFLTSLLAGQGSGALLPLCAQIRKADIFGLGGAVAIKASAGPSQLTQRHNETAEEEEDWLSVGMEMGMEGSLGWEKTENSDHKTLTKTVRRSLEIKASLSFLPESISEPAQMVAESLNASGTSVTGGILDSITKKSSLEKTLMSLSYEEKREIATAPNGTLEHAEKTRIFNLDTPAEAREILQQQGVPKEVIRDIEEDLQEYGVGGFRIEINATLGKSAVDGYNSEKKELPAPSSYALTEVRLVFDEVSAAQKKGLALGDLTLAHEQSGKREKTLRYRATG